MRNISASLTADQIIASVELVKAGKSPVKDITRREGWLDVEVGERLQVCRKCMGRKKGEPLEKLAVIEVVSVRRERLDALTFDYPDRGLEEVKREGFEHVPGIEGSPDKFIVFFCKSHKKCTPETVITRIEFKYIV